MAFKRKWLDKVALDYLGRPDVIAAQYKGREWPFADIPDVSSIRLAS